MSCIQHLNPGNKKTQHMSLDLQTQHRNYHPWLKNGEVKTNNDDVDDGDNENESEDGDHNGDDNDEDDNECDDQYDNDVKQKRM